jgi:hypothetical protein
MYTIRRMNALTPKQSIILVKLVNKEPVSPKSLSLLNSIFSKHSLGTDYASSSIDSNRVK